MKVKSLSRVRPSATPWTAAYQAPPSMGFSRQEYWSGVPLPSPRSRTSSFFPLRSPHSSPYRQLANTAAAAKSLQSCPTLCDPIDGSLPGSLVPGILQARTLEWVAISFSKVKSESEVAQSCPTLSDPRDCSLPGFSVHGFSRQEYWSGVPLPSPAVSINLKQR